MLKGTKINIDVESIDSWLAVTGFILPRNNEELIGFNKLHNDFNHELNGDELDVQKLWNGEKQSTLSPDKIIAMDAPAIGMAARGLNDLPKDLLDKLKKNQDDIIK